MDPSAEALQGPHPVRPNHTVSVPKALLGEIGVISGEDSVHWMLNPTLPGTLVLVPTKMVARAMSEILQALHRAST